MWADVADVAQDEADEHEEEADQREGGGRADHLWWERSRGQVRDPGSCLAARLMWVRGWVDGACSAMPRRDLLGDNSTSMPYRMQRPHRITYSGH